MGIIHELHTLRGRGIARIDYRLPVDIAHDGSQSADVVGERLVETDGGFYLVKIDLAAILNEEIDLETLVVAHEVHIRLKSSIESGLQDVSDHHVLEKAAKCRIPVHLIRVANAEKVAAQTNIREVHLGSLDEPLSEIAVVAWEREGYVARLKDG